MPRHSVPLFLFSLLLFMVFALSTQAQGNSKPASDQSGPPAQGKVLEETHGPWRATCFVDGGSPEPYCRVMVLHFFNRSSRNPDFAQFGPAFDRGQQGFIVATYFGFTRESHISVGIDNNPPINMPAPASGNHIVAPPNVSAQLIEQMQTGETIHVAFRTNMRGQVKLRYPLDGFKLLQEETKATLKK